MLHSIYTRYDTDPRQYRTLQIQRLTKDLKTKLVSCIIGIQCSDVAKSSEHTGKVSFAIFRPYVETWLGLGVGLEKT